MYIVSYFFLLYEIGLHKVYIYIAKKVILSWGVNTSCLRERKVCQILQPFHQTEQECDHSPSPRRWDHLSIYEEEHLLPCAIGVQWSEQCNLGTSPRFSPLNENKFAIYLSTWMSASVFGSTLAVASSRTMILFLPRIARAKHTSCLSPTERLDPGDELSWSQLIKLDPGYDEEDFDGWHWPS